MAKTFNVKTVFTSKDKTSLVMKGIGNQASKTVGQIKTVGKVAGAALLAGGIAVVKMANDFAVMGDNAAKTSRRLGLTAEFLQEFSFAADRAGVSGEETIKSLEKLNKNVGDLRAGTGSLKTILQNTNPELAEQFKNVQSNEEAFELITNAINKLPSQIDKASLAQAAFGRSGLKMLTVMEGGIEGINELRKEARKYGVQSNASALASELYVDSLTNLQAASKGLTLSLNTRLIPVMTKVITAVTNFITANKELIQTKLDIFVKNATVFFTNFYKVSKTTYNIFIKFLPLIKAIAVGFVAYKLAIIGAVVAQKSYIAVLAFGKFIKFIRIVHMMAKAKGIATAVQWAWNAAMTANPIGIIIVAIGVLIGLIYLLVKNWETIKTVMVNAIKMAWEWIQKFIAKIVELWDIFKGLLLPFAAPFVILIEVLRSVFSHWAKIKEAFTNKGFLGGILEIGKAIISGILAPIKALLKLLAKIPGLKKIAGAGLDLTNSLDQKIGMGDMPTPETSAISKVSDKTISSKSTVDINVNDKNNNADVEQKGNLQGINFTLNQGVQ